MHSVRQGLMAHDGQPSGMPDMNFMSASPETTLVGTRQACTACNESSKSDTEATCCMLEAQPGVSCHHVCLSQL